MREQASARLYVLDDRRAEAGPQRGGQGRLEALLDPDLVLQRRSARRTGLLLRLRDRLALHLPRPDPSQGCLPAPGGGPAPPPRRLHPTPPTLHVPPTL